jgi:ketosteroid isomerase-like protein
MSGQYEGAQTPDEITRLFVERANAGDADGVADLYEEDAVMAFPPGQLTRGRAAIRDLMATAFGDSPSFASEEPLPTIYAGDIALTSTPSADDKGTRVQVVRRQPDGTWRRVIDRPEPRSS